MLAEDRAQYPSRVVVAHHGSRGQLDGHPTYQILPRQERVRAVAPA
jgi:hypothetical protein